jgi:hypothetical protein
MVVSEDSRHLFGVVGNQSHPFPYSGGLPENPMPLFPRSHVATTYDLNTGAESTDRSYPDATIGGCRVALSSKGSI